MPLNSVWLVTLKTSARKVNFQSRCRSKERRIALSMSALCGVAQIVWRVFF
jgi:hypothetical protein